jgi:uncharacterized protein YdeI (YjbR/CyaY-like superfamily)
MRIAKKDSGLESISYSDAIDVALCYGWIDGQKGKGDAATWLQKFTPRAKRSIWSKRNQERVAALIESGRMKAPGLAEVERAKADGRWAQAYDSAKTATVPDDLQQALDGNAKAKKFFATLDATNRYAILWRVQTAKKPETRARRIAQFVDMLAKGGKLHG